MFDLKPNVQDDISNAEYKIYIPEQYRPRDIWIEYPGGHFEVNPAKMPEKMKSWLKGVICSNQWRSYETITGWNEPEYNQTFYSVNRLPGFRGYLEHCALHWLVLGEVYRGGHYEEMLGTLGFLWQSLSRASAIKMSAYWNFSGGLFSKPRWIEEKDRRIAHRF